jgi:hypothetical protein
MQSLEYEWDSGEVGDYWLRIGLNYKTAHVYQTPWTGNSWWAEAVGFDLEKINYSSLYDAQDAAENAAERWFSKAIYQTPQYRDDGDLDGTG